MKTFILKPHMASKESLSMLLRARKVLSSLIQHKVMTFSGVKYFLTFWGPAPTQSCPYWQAALGGPATQVTLKGEFFIDPYTKPCP